MNLIFERTLVDLKTHYKDLSWLKRLFFPKALGELLENWGDEHKPKPTEADAWAICQAYLNQTWFFQRWFFNCLDVFSNSLMVTLLTKFQGFDTESAQEHFNAAAQHNKPEAVNSTLVRLQNEGLLAGEFAKVNCEKVVKHATPWNISFALTSLKKARLLDGELAQVNFSVVAQHKNPGDVADALVLLQEANLLNGESAQANREAVAKHAYPKNVAEAIISLSRVGLLAGDSGQANREALATSQYFTQDRADVIISLHYAGLLTGDTGQTNREKIAACYNPNAIVKILSVLQPVGLLTGELAQANFNVVIQHKDADAVAAALVELQNAGLLTGKSGQANYQLMANHAHPQKVVDAIIILNQNGLLTNELAQAIAKHKNFYDITKLIYAFYIMKEAGLLTSEFAQVVSEHKNPYEMANAFVSLQKAGLLADDLIQTNFNALVTHKDPFGVANALVLLQEAGLLASEFAQANFNALVKHKAPFGVANALIMLQTGLFTGEFAQANREVVTQHDYPSCVARVLVMLQETGLFTGDFAQINFNAVTQHESIKPIEDSLIFMKDQALLTGQFAQANLNALIKHPDYLSVGSCIYRLSVANLLTQANFNLVTDYQTPLALANALSILHKANLLTNSRGQEYFDLLIKHADILLISDLWYRVPEQRFTATHFQNMVQIAQQYGRDIPEAQRQLRNYVNRDILGNTLEEGLFNRAQSTHTASVHQSVSESAKKLKDCYGEQLKGDGLDSTLDALKDWGNQVALQNGDLIRLSVPKCLERILAKEYYFQDPESKVQTKELLALFWLAVQDEEKRQGTLEDAQQQLIEALYEIQRGYNLSDKGVDNKLEDRPICSGGTFNKLVEKLAGIHALVEVRFVTKEGAVRKFPIVVREEVEAHLKTLANQPSGITDELREKLDKDGVDAIWDAIQPKVKKLILDEFGPIYTNENGTTNAAFAELMAQSSYIDIEELLKQFSSPIKETAMSHSSSQNPQGFFHKENASDNEPENQVADNLPPIIDPLFRSKFLI